MREYYMSFQCLSVLVYLFREKKLLVSSTDYGKDLSGVQKQLRNHKKLEDELNTHEQELKVIIALFNVP